MKVTILGTGTFYVNKLHSGPAYLLEADDKKILIDCGPGTLIRLSEIGLSPFDIDYILITHLHADHTSDLFSLLMNFRLKEFDDPNYRAPIVYGPTDITTFIKRLSEVYQLPAFDNYDKVEFLQVQPSFQVGNINVKTFSVSHTAFGLKADAYSYRFEIDGKIFTFSGDTIKCPGIEEACQGADLLICDSSYSKGKGNLAHMSTTEIGEIASKSLVKKVVLSHIYPAYEGIDLISEVKEQYSGIVERGSDLIKIEI